MVKRVGNLMWRIASLDNLQEAFLRAAKGKQGKKAVIEFRSHLDENLMVMHDQLIDDRYEFSPYHFFKVFDPKERQICAGTFRDRVVSHAIMRICHPVFDNYQIFDSYASRIGKGQYKALGRAEYFASRYQWFAKLDVTKFFDSIHHETLVRQLTRLFKDKQLLLYFRDLIDSYEFDTGRGIPIGNLTSQYFANHYLATCDHYMKEHIHVPALVRYMDDIVLFSPDLHLLNMYVRDVIVYMRDELHLVLHNPIINQCRNGIPFLGYVVYPHELRLNKRSKRRFRYKLKRLSVLLKAGEISQKDYANRATCLFAFVQKADTTDFLYKTSKIKGLYPQGL